MLQAAYRCHHNTYPGSHRRVKAAHKKHTACPAVLKVTIKSSIENRRVRYIFELNSCIKLKNLFKDKFSSFSINNKTDLLKKKKETVILRCLIKERAIADVFLEHMVVFVICHD